MGRKDNSVPKYRSKRRYILKFKKFLTLCITIVLLYGLSSCNKADTSFSDKSNESDLSGSTSAKINLDDSSGSNSEGEVSSSSSSFNSLLSSSALNGLSTGSSSESSNTILESLVDQPILNSIPKGSEVDLEKSPLLWDICNDTLGWHVDIHFNITSAYAYFLYDTRNPKFVLTFVYQVQDPIYPPHISAIMSIDLTEEQVTSFQEAASKLPSDYIISDGNLRLLCVDGNDSSTYIYGENNDNYSTVFWGGVDISSYPIFHDLSEGPERPSSLHIDGWPTEWLRRAPYDEWIFRQLGINIHEAFWDTHNLEQMYYSVPAKESSLSDEEGEYVVRLIDEDSFEWGSDDNKDGLFDNLDYVEELDQYRLEIRANTVGISFPGLYEYDPSGPTEGQF